MKTSEDFIHDLDASPELAQLLDSLTALHRRFGAGATRIRLSAQGFGRKGKYEIVVHPESSLRIRKSGASSDVVHRALDQVSA